MFKTFKYVSASHFLLLSSLVIIVLSMSCMDSIKNKAVSPDGSDKADFFFYALLGVQPLVTAPNSINYWAYSRVFSHPDYQNVQAELSHENSTIPLEANYWETDKFFTEGDQDLMFDPGDTYGFRLWDTDDSYTGTIQTLAPMELQVDTVINDRIRLEWADIGADFYDIELRVFGEFEEHYRTENTQFVLDIDELPYGLYTEINIDIAGFKGFSPLSNPDGNIEGCYGFLFGYSVCGTTLDLQTMAFAKPSTDSPPPNLDALILSFYENIGEEEQNTGANGVDFQFTYAYISNSSLYPSSWSDFTGVTLAEPAGSITSFDGYVDDTLMDKFVWGGFYHILHSQDDIYAVYNQETFFEFKLTINNQEDSAYVAIPDTFSITDYPPEAPMPSAPFDIRWRRPFNADYFIVDVSWEIEDNPIDRNELYITENNRFTITEVPAGAIEGEIYVTAIYGANPMRSLQPNLARLNGYFFSRRLARNSVTFYPELPGGSLSRTSSSREKAAILDRRIDRFLVSRLAETFPRLRRHTKHMFQYSGRTDR